MAIITNHLSKLPIQKKEKARNIKKHMYFFTKKSTNTDDEFEVKKLMSHRNGRTVHKLKQKSTGTFFAGKTVYTGDGCNKIKSDVLQAQFDQETELLLTFDHPNVVKCHGVAFDIADSKYKILLEYMDGGSLEGKHISNVGELADVSRQVLQGLAYMHRRRVPHWDIKPSNLLRNGHVVKIADFGVSRYLTTIRDHREFMDTLSYVSPERIDVELNDDVSSGPEYFGGDIWGFGMTILEAYMGRYPIDGEPPVKEGVCMRLMKAIVEAAPPRAPPSAPADFSDFISCCLRKEAASRWTAAELLQHPFILQRGAGADE